VVATTESSEEKPAIDQGEDRMINEGYAAGVV
jgi:hypothetical protein